MSAVPKIKAPFPYFGGKSRIAGEVWKRFGRVSNYVEPFFGSGAVLLARPRPFSGAETVNDADGMLSNFWRAIKHDPDAVAEHADWPVNECDLHARHIWLVNRKDGLTERLMGDPDYFDPKAAGWWVWGLCSWIGSGWCSGNGSWKSIDGVLAKGLGLGRGINRQRPHLGGLGRGINRQIPHLGDLGQGINAHREKHRDCDWNTENIRETFAKLSDRFRNVRVCCGDWSRVCGPSVLYHPTSGKIAVFLDPPYSEDAGRDPAIYTVESLTVAKVARKWAIDHAKDERLRIALCGYDDEHDMPDTWECFAWKTNGGYANQGNTVGANKRRERIWFSPNCIRPFRTLFD